MSAADLRESVAKAIGEAECGGDTLIDCLQSFYGEPPEALLTIASVALRAIAGAGFVIVPREPTEEMIGAAAEEIEQGVKDYACDDMDGGGFVTVEQASEIARSALSAALKEMG